MLSLFIIIINIISYLQCLSGINTFYILDRYCKSDSPKKHEAQWRRSLTQKFEASLNSHLRVPDIRCQVILASLHRLLHILSIKVQNMITLFYIVDFRVMGIFRFFGFLGFRVQNLVFFSVQGLGFRVQGSGFGNPFQLQKSQFDMYHCGIASPKNAIVG